MKENFLRSMIKFIALSECLFLPIGLLYVFGISHFENWGVFGSALSWFTGAYLGSFAYFYHVKEFDVKEENFYRVCKKDCANVKKCKHWSCKGWDMCHPESSNQEN